MSWKPAATVERKIHSQKREGRARGKDGGTLNGSERETEKGERGREGRRNLPTYPLLYPRLFFFHPVEVVNGFLLGDLPRCVNVSAG